MAPKISLLFSGLKHSILHTVFMIFMCYQNVCVGYTEVSPIVSKVRQEQHKISKCSVVQ